MITRSLSDKYETQALQKLQLYFLIDQIFSQSSQYV